MVREKRRTKLTLEDIKSDVLKFNELKVVALNADKHTEVYKYFDPVKIDAAVDDLGVMLNEYEKTIGKFPKHKILDYLNLHIILHFSTITDNLPTVLGEKIALFESIVKSEMLETIFEAFDSDEIRKVYDRMIKKLNAAQEFYSHRDKTIKQLNQYIDSSELENKNELKKVFLGMAE